jgi:DNA repair exonuclease SbcCD ATPase subunit
MQLTTNVRREVIEDLLDIRVFSSMALLLKDRVSGNRQALTMTEHDITNTTNNIKLQEKLRKDLAQEKSEKIDEYRSRIEDARTAVMRNEAEAATIETEINDLLEQIEDKDTVSARIQKILNLESNLEKKKANARKTIKFYHDNDECPTCTQTIDSAIKCEKIEEKEKVVSEVDDALQTLQSNLGEAELRLSEITRIQREVNSRQHLLRDVQSSIKSSQKEISLWEKEIDSASKGSVAFNEDTITQLKEEYDTFLSKKQEYLDEREMYDLATVILRDSGIKSRIIKQYIPVINTLVNKYLAAMDFFVKFELNESFEESILSRHRDDFTYDSFSEGEKMRIDLSLLFTWRSIARMKNSAHTNLLILDEVFDASLDANGCDEFLKLIHSLENSNIFVISHKGDVLHDKFSNTLRFRKEKNFSRIAS